jgi:16S rRNA processing protein RimM
LASQVSAGRVGRVHGLDGSFYVDGASRPLPEGAEVRLDGEPRVIARSAGTAERPLVRLDGVEAREAAASLRGRELTIAADDEPEEGEWLVSELVGCRVPGLGAVARVMQAPSCDVLELEDGRLVPLVSDAIRRVDPAAGVVEVDLAFLGEEERT